MKTAVYNGKEIHFPPDMPDDHMDAAIAALAQKSGGSKPAEKDNADPDVVEGLLKTISASKKKREEDDKNTQAKSEQYRAEDRSLKDNANQQKMIALSDIADMIDNISTALLPLEGQEIPEKLDVLTEAVNNLSTTIKESVSTLVKTMMMEAVIKKDSTGAPVAMQRGGSSLNNKA